MRKPRSPTADSGETLEENRLHLASGGRRRLPRWVGALLALILMVFAWRIFTSGRLVQHPQDAASDAQISTHELSHARPIEVPADGYVSSQGCRDCHPHEHETWSASFHRTMTQLAATQSVVGDFDDVTVEDRLNTRQYHLRQQHGEFWVNMDDPDTPHGGARIDRPLVMTTGSHHMQMYWFPVGHSRILGQLPIVYLNTDQRWIPRYAAFLRPPSQSHFFAETGRWNLTCINCHTTHGRTRPQGALGWDTQVAEFGISCEACHGPAEGHLRVHHVSSPVASGSKAVIEDTIVNPAELSYLRSSQVCGRCHGISMPLSPQASELQLAQGYDFRPGQELAETRFVIRRDDASREHLRQFHIAYPDEESITRTLDGYFWADGMVRVSGREYNGLIESACHQRGELSCLSCHVMHKPTDDSRDMLTWADDQLRAESRGDRACLNCHQADRFQTQQHTHHPPDSDGSRCYNCHMPHTTYGLMKAIRSHTIDSPSVSASVETGRPNACNLCHLDRSLEWSADHLSQWYGTPQPELDEDDRSLSAAVLWSLRGDAGQRAVVAWSMGWRPAVEASGAEWMPPYLANLLEDPYHAVRYIAGRSLKSLPGWDDVPYDFLAAPEQRAAVAAQVLERWSAITVPGDQARDELLMDRRGTLKTTLVERLKRQRDDRPVALEE